VLPQADESGVAHSPTQAVVSEETFDGLRHGVMVPGSHEQAVDAVFNDFGNAACRCRHN
jgi:hypothetical protein